MRDEFTPDCPECGSDDTREVMRGMTLPSGGQSEYVALSCRGCGHEVSL